jgi:hypothetical protein
MTQARTFTTTDADRLLQFGDQYMDDWSADRFDDDNYDERRSEWNAIRPLLVSAPALLAVLDEAEIVWGEAFDNDNPVDGGDLVEWFAEWLPKARAAIATARGQDTDSGEAMRMARSEREEGGP